MSAYKLKVGCPRCGRTPSVRFHERQLIHARRERQGALIQEVQCGRDTPFRCRYRWWVRARDIAEAVPDRPIVEPEAIVEPPPPVVDQEPPSAPTATPAWPAGFPERALGALRGAGIESARALLEVRDWLSIPGIGPATEREMRAALAEPQLIE